MPVVFLASHPLSPWLNWCGFSLFLLHFISRLDSIHMLTLLTVIYTLHFSLPSLRFHFSPTPIPIKWSYQVLSLLGWASSTSTVEPPLATTSCGGSRGAMGGSVEPPFGSLISMKNTERLLLLKSTFQGIYEPPLEAPLHRILDPSQTSINY